MYDDLMGRIIVETDDGPVYGVGRVRYNAGHDYAGHYEVERADGTSFLAPRDACRVGSNWSDTPEEGRFTGAEFFRPSFLAGATRQDERLFTRSHGVVVESDVTLLRDLIATIRPGQSVEWYSHGCNEFRGLVKVTSVDDKGMRVKGKGNPPPYCGWPTTGEPEIGPQYGYEFEVRENVLHFVHVPPARTGRPPSKYLTLTF